MSVNTHGLLKGKITPEEILNFIKQKHDINADMDCTIYNLTYKNYMQEIYGDTDDLYDIVGYITFRYKNKPMSLFYSYSNYNPYENLDYYLQYNLEDMVKSETTYLSLYHSTSSVEIIKDIVIEFGGWIDENDCDDEPYYPIFKDADNNIKPIIYVTMEDIYEKFGGVVVIKK